MWEIWNRFHYRRLNFGGKMSKIVSLCLSVYMTLFVCVYDSVCLWIWLCLLVRMTLVYDSVCLCIWLSFSVYLTLFICVYDSVCLCAWLCLSVYMTLFVCAYDSVCLCIWLCLSVHMTLFVCSYDSVCMCIWLKRVRNTKETFFQITWLYDSNLTKHE